jgi:hypothetical protein
MIFISDEDVVLDVEDGMFLESIFTIGRTLAIREDGVSVGVICSSMIVFCGNVLA